MIPKLHKERTMLDFSSIDVSKVILGIKNKQKAKKPEENAKNKK